MKRTDWLISISSTCNPTASDRRIPVSLMRASSHLFSSSIFTHSSWIAVRASNGIGRRFFDASSIVNDEGFFPACTRHSIQAKSSTVK